jgi:hypothetical protein
MADWFKVKNDMLDSKGMQFCISEQPLVTSVWLVILSEASKNRSSFFSWLDADFEVIGFSRKINCDAKIFNQCLDLLERIGYIKRAHGKLQIVGWESHQSDYAKGLNKGYYKKTSEKLASNSLDSTARGEEKRVDNTPISPSGDERFSAFWKAYPKKIGIGLAKKKFALALKSTSVETILKAIESQKQSEQWKKDGGQFIPHPATWLNQGRWNDEMKIEMKSEIVGGRL